MLCCVVLRTQVHIALAGASSQGMAVSWVTVENTLSSTVLYGTESGNLQFTVTGHTSSYWESIHHHGQSMHHHGEYLFVYYLCP